MVSRGFAAEIADQVSFGSNYIELLLSRLGIRLEIVNMTDNSRDELMTDLVSIVTGFAARLYGQRRAKCKTEAVISALQSTEPDTEKETIA